MLRFVKEETITIKASPEAVYDYVSDISRHPEWAFHKLTMKKVGDGRFESSTEVMHLEPRSVLTVETTNRPGRFSFISQDSVAGTYRWYFDISPVAEGSRLNYGLERLKARLWVQLVQPWLLWPTDGRKGVLGALANIKRNIEGPAQPTDKSRSRSLATPERGGD
jgi:hypothetical protein